ERRRARPGLARRRRGRRVHDRRSRGSALGTAGEKMIRFGVRPLQRRFPLVCQPSQHRKQNESGDKSPHSKLAISRIRLSWVWSASASAALSSCLAAFATQKTKQKRR